MRYLVVLGLSLSWPGYQWAVTHPANPALLARQAQVPKPRRPQLKPRVWVKPTQNNPPAPTKITGPSAPTPVPPAKPAGPNKAQLTALNPTHLALQATTTKSAPPLLCPSTAPPVAGCVPAGSQTTGTPCCSGYVDKTTLKKGNCQGTGTCSTITNSCFSNMDCTCIDTSPNCTASDGGDCNENTCYCSTYPYNVCTITDDCNDQPSICVGYQAPICLSVVGQNCTSNTECLSGSCVNNICVTQTDGAPCDPGCDYVAGQPGSCVNQAWSCVADGAACVNPWDCCNPAHSCLANNTCGAGAAEKATCQVGQDCASGNCDTTGKNPLCATGQSCCTCLAGGATCTANLNCCPLTTGNICVNSICTACGANNASCSNVGDCCSANCQQGKCACQLVGKPCLTNLGCCSGVCTNNYCQPAPSGGICATDPDCKSSLCDNGLCVCVLENQPCYHSENCCGELECRDNPDGSPGKICQCYLAGTTCTASHQCCQGAGSGSGGSVHLACLPTVGGTGNSCQIATGCPENLGLDLATIHSYFMSPPNPLTGSCQLAYKLLIYNYTLLAQYLKLVTHDPALCTGTYQTTLTDLVQQVYRSIVAVEAGCWVGTNPAVFVATSQVDALNQHHSADLTSTASVTTNLALNQTIVQQLSATNTHQALQWGTFANQGCPKGSTSCCQQSNEPSSCFCEANATASCISQFCCAGDIQADLVAQAASLVVTQCSATSCPPGASPATPLSRTTINPIMAPLSSLTGNVSTNTTGIVDPASLFNSDGSINPNYLYAVTADRFASLVGCWLATLPTSCKPANVIQAAASHLK